MKIKKFFKYITDYKTYLQEKTRGVRTGNDPLLHKSPLQHEPLYCPVLGLSGECSFVLHIKYCKSLFSMQPF